MKVPGYISIVILCVVTMSAFAGSPIWATQGGSPGRTGCSAYAGPEQGCIAWTFEPGGSVSASCAIGQTGDIYLSSEDAFLYAIDPNGNQIWSHNAGSAVTSSPTIDKDGTIYVGTSAGLLRAVDPNGSEKWSFSASGSIYAAPAIAGDLIVAGSMDGNLYATNTSGTLTWTFSPNHPDSIVAAPTMGSDGIIYVGRLYDPNVYAIDPTDGSVIWSRNLSHTFTPDDPSTNMVHTGYQISPVFHPDSLVLIAPAIDSKLYALDPVNGEIVWELNLYHPPQKPLGETISDVAYGYSDIWSEPVVAPDGTIYVSMDDMYLRAVNPDGTLKWVQRIGMYGGLTMTVDVNGLIYAASDDKSLYVIEPEYGTVLSTMTFYDVLANAYASGSEEWLSFPMLGGNGLLYVGSSTGKLYAVQAGNCLPKALHWTANLNQNDRVNLEDFVPLADAWQTCLDAIFKGNQCNPYSSWYPLYSPYPKADMNRDFHVNMDDLILLIESWMKEETL